MEPPVIRGVLAPWTTFKLKERTVANPLFFFALMVGWVGLVLGLMAIARTAPGWKFTAETSRKYVHAAAIVLGAAHLLQVINGIVNTAFYASRAGAAANDPFAAFALELVRKNALFGVGLGLLLTAAMSVPVVFAFQRLPALPKAGGLPELAPIPFSTPIAVVLHFLGSGLFTSLKLALMHGQLRPRRADDPNAGKAAGFLFIPFFNLYWLFFMYGRLATRVNEALAESGSPRRVSDALVITTCVLTLVPFVGWAAFAVLWPIVLGQFQSAMNELACGRRDEAALAMAA